jgi:hypothetical protein
MNAPATLLGLLVGDRIAEPDARPSSILIDEFDAGGLECSPYDIEGRSTWLVRAALELANGDNADSGLVREILLTPIEKAPGGPALIWRDHPNSMHEVIYLFNYVEKELTRNVVLFIAIYVVIRFNGDVSWSQSAKAV